MDIFEEFSYITKNLFWDRNLVFITVLLLLLSLFSLFSYLFLKHKINKNQAESNLNSSKLPGFLFSFLFYPLFFLIKGLRESKTIFNKISCVIVSFFVLFPAWVIGVLSFLTLVWLFGTYSGFLRIQISTVGSSMLPTILQDSKIGLKRYPGLKYFNSKIERGDIIVFSNSKTQEELKKRSDLDGTFIKRVIGVSGDKVLIRNGFVLVNNEVINEPYILKPRSTFGGKEIKECQGINVPDGMFLVLGDNRKRSLDSRDIGLVSINDIKFFLPYTDQKSFFDRWRDTSQDFNFANKSTLKTQEYIRLLNNKRRKSGLETLKYNEKLSESARKRAIQMLTYDDFSSDAEKSGYTMKEALKDVGYKNIVYGEFPILGYYDENELIDYIFEFEESKEFVMNKDYQDIGISTFVGNLNGCPTQIVVQHMGGYIPPNYKNEEINSWKEVLSLLKQIQPGWKETKNYEYFYKTNKKGIDRLNEIIELRIKNIEDIIATMEKNKWLTDEQVEYTYNDEKLHEEQEMIAKELNENGSN